MLGGPTYCIAFDGLDVQRHYVVKGTPIRPVDSRPRLFEVVPDEIAGDLDGASDLLGKGLFVRLVSIADEVVKGPFMFEISDFTEPA